MVETLARLWESVAIENRRTFRVLAGIGSREPIRADLLDMSNTMRYLESEAPRRPGKPPNHCKTMSINGSPRNPGTHARQIARFVARCPH